MTPKLRWLAALALLLAFGLTAVRAEEEEEVVTPPARTSVEILPMPKLLAAQAAPCCQSCGSSCACCSQCCAQAKTTEPAQFVVKTKIVHAGADGDCEETLSPNVTVLDGQTAHFLFYGEQTAAESRSFSMRVRVASLEKGVRLNFGVEDRLDSHDGNSGEHTQTDSMRTDCNVTLGKMKRVVLKKDADGTDRAWAEVTVMAIPPEEDENDSALDYVGEVVDDLLDTLADVATTLFGDDEERVPVESVEYRVPVIAAPVMAPCPACKQCAAVEAVKTPVKKIRIVVANGQKCVECSDGDKSWKMTADRITVRDGCLVMEGNIRGESSDGSMKYTAEKISVKLETLDIHIGD